MQYRLLTENIFNKFGPKAQMSYIRYLRRPNLETPVLISGTAEFSGPLTLDGVSITPISDTTATVELDRALLEQFADLEALLYFEVDGQLVP